VGSSSAVRDSGDVDAIGIASRAVRAQSDGVKGEYVLSSAARAKRIQQLVSSG
jgi:hypothetical protein